MLYSESPCLSKCFGFMYICISILDHSMTSSRTDFADAIYSSKVAQIRVGNDEFSLHVTHLGVGAELEIPISYYDALGTVLLIFIFTLLALDVIRIKS